MVIAWRALLCSGLWFCASFPLGSVLADSVSNLVIVTEKDNGGQTSLAREDVLVVKLTSQPGTGYGWRLMSTSGDVLRVLGKPEVETGEGNIAGRSDLEVFRLKALTSGSCAIEFQYVRSWQPDAAPGKTFKLQVHVK